jgi:zinc/manganese transport system substrate-binding protein
MLGDPNMLFRRQFLAGLALTPVAARAMQPLGAVATISILADMIRQIGGNEVDVVSLVPPDGDVHTYQSRPGDLLAMRRARVLVENGLGLEGWMDRLRSVSGFAGVRVVAAEAVRPRHFVEDGATMIDPHAWQDPRNGVRYVRAIAAGLAKADPAHADAWRARADAYVAEIAATDVWITTRLSVVPPQKRQIVTSHDAFGYYGDRYGIRLHSVEGISTDAEPSARDLARLIDDIRAQGIRAVFIDNMTDPRLVATVAQDAGVTVGPRVYSDTLSPPGGPADTYIKMLRYNTASFADAMLTNR